jgi:hypothetical protein
MFSLAGVLCACIGSLTLGVYSLRESRIISKASWSFFNLAFVAFVWSLGVLLHLSGFLREAGWFGIYLAEAMINMVFFSMAIYFINVLEIRSRFSTWIMVCLFVLGLAATALLFVTRFLDIRTDGATSYTYTLVWGTPLRIYIAYSGGCYGYLYPRGRLPQGGL